MKNLHLVCPQCHTPLPGENCPGCLEVYPKLGDIPWVVPQPKAHLQDWAMRYRLSLQVLDEEINNLKAHGKKSVTLSATPKRLQRLLQAKIENKKYLEELLAPLVKQGASTAELYKAGGISVPPSQTLTGYYHNIHRDWSWDTDENAQSLDCIVRLIAEIPQSMSPLGKTVVLGCGAGRLGYDLHQTGLAKETYLLDFNPLMLIVAHRMMQRRSLKLFEFPLAPRTLGDAQVLRKLSAPHPPLPNLFILAGDALKTPFAHGSVDTVVTPWLVDILPVDARILIDEIARILRPGGLWIYFGSMTFNHKQISLNYSPEEFHELLGSLSFTIEKSENRIIPYMGSPASNHSRLERVTTLISRWNPSLTNQTSESTGTLHQIQKSGSLNSAPDNLPPWLIEFDLPVPRTPQIQSKNLVHQISAQLLSLVDGQRSLRQMAERCTEMGLLQHDEAEAYWFRFLKRLHLEEGSLQGF